VGTASGAPLPCVADTAQKVYGYLKRHIVVLGTEKGKVLG